MSKPITSEALPERLIEHRAVQAWGRLGPERISPDGIEILKLRNKSAVYRLLGVGSDGSSVIAKKCRAATASVERLIYEEFLSQVALPTLRFYGMVEEPDGEFCWLFLESADEQEFSTSNREHRALAARWLATIHQAAANSGLESRLPSREPDHYLDLLRSSRDTLVRHLVNPELRLDDLKVLQALAAQYDLLEAHWTELVEICATAPRTLVHGDFAAKNVRVRATESSLALLTFDWECAGWGVPATDFVQFMGRTISPDLAIYCAETKGTYPRLDLLSARRLSDCGGFFRLIDDISWAASFLVFDSYLFLEKPMSYLKSYELRLVEAQGALGWTQ